MLDQVGGLQVSCGGMVADMPNLIVTDNSRADVNLGQYVFAPIVRTLLVRREAGEHVTIAMRSTARMPPEAYASAGYRDSEQCSIGGKSGVACSGYENVQAVACNGRAAHSKRWTPQHLLPGLSSRSLSRGCFFV